MIVRAGTLTAAVLLLAGCSFAPTPVVTPTVVPSAVITFVAPPKPAPGIVGTGVLNGDKFTVSWDGTDFFITGLGTLPEAASSHIVLTTGLLALGSCDSGYGVRFSPPLDVPLAISGKQTSADASFLTAISQTAPATLDCPGRVIASAPIDWTTPVLYPELSVTDSGVTRGARGEVTIEDGVVASYLVEQGDVREDVAARFGLTADQLVWLNPRRALASIDTVVNGETLNLRPDRR